MLTKCLASALTALLSGLVAAEVRADTTLAKALSTVSVRRTTTQGRKPIVPSTPDQWLALIQQRSESVLVMERTNRSIATTGDPLWDLRLEIPGQPARHFAALSGRANRQTANRDQMGSRAPLPQGHYTLGAVEPLANGAYPELGPIWISIEPTFTTGRRVLGIHQDPSAGLNANSGTLGCIGLIRRKDILELSDLIRRSGTRQLVVRN